MAKKRKTKPQHNPALKYDLNVLFTMLTYQRPAFSRGEQDFITRFIDVLPGVESDNLGNRWVITDATSRTLFSAHTDTVHPKHDDTYRQNLQITDQGVLSTTEKQQLGADNGVGCWILMNMIAAGVPGTYIFHRAEEVGGKGSSYIADHYGETLAARYDRAIAFDRKGTNSIITHQSMERGCSDLFATALSETLGLGHEMDDGGTFTDTRNYFSLIPECTNVSAGYQNEHTFNETLDTRYAEKLAIACVKAQWETLPTARDPSVTEFSDDYNYYGNWNRWNSHYDTPHDIKRLPRKAHDVPDLYTLVYENPDAIAELLVDLAVDTDEVWEFIQLYKKHCGAH